MFELESEPIHELIDRLGLADRGLAGQVALVTGGARGIGEQVARGLAHLGALVAIVDYRQKGAWVAADIEAAGGRARFFLRDLTEPDTLPVVIAETEACFGPIDVLVNNAVEFDIRAVEEIGLESWDRTFASNVRAPFEAIHRLLPGMRNRGRGIVLNMVAPHGLAYASDMSASKAALRSLTISLAAEVADDSGVHVVGFLPGLVDTPLVADVFPRYTARLGITLEQYVEDFRPNPGYPGLMPRQHCGASVVHAIAHAADHHGLVVDPFAPLFEAGIATDDGEQWQALGAAGPHDNVAQLRDTVREVTLHNRALDRLVRQRTQALQRELLERRAAEAEARKLADVVRSSNDAVILATAEGICMGWNEGAERLFGYTAAEMIGQPISRLVPPESRAQLALHFEGFRRGERLAPVDARRIARDGTHKDVELAVFPVFDSVGKLTCVAANLRDIARRKAAERAAQERADEMARALEALEATHSELVATQEELRQSAKMAAMGQLAGGIAHDFNNMLTAILTFTGEVIEELGPDHRCAADLQCVIDAGMRTRDLTRQLLTFSRKEPVSLQLLELDDVLFDLRPLLTSSLGEDIAIGMDCAPALPPIRMDRIQLEQVILNLAVNARDAMPRGGAIRFAARTLYLGPETLPAGVELNAGQYVTLTVADDGHGMTPQMATRIFEPFFTTKDVGQGVGMGLATVYGIVHGAGGDIGVTSVPGRGTTFRIYLPVASTRPGATAGSRATPVPRGEQHVVLLVEDEDLVRRAAARILRRHGYVVLTANGAPEALSILDARQGKIDVMVTDVIMPGVSGPDLAAQVARLYPDVALLYISGYAESVIARREIGPVDPLVPKPFTNDSLPAAVRGLLDARNTSLPIDPRRTPRSGPESRV